MTEKDKLILEIMALAYAVDRNTEYCVFINYYGHVGMVDIEIAESATDYQNKIASTQFYVDGRYENDNVGWLKAKRDHLKSILADGEIDVSEMTEVVIETVKHSF